jgi:hypothetical protein
VTGGRASRLSPQTVSRLEKLLLMLSSPLDGEALSAARAIGRTLQNSGRDWHDLTASLTVPAKTKTKARDDASDTGDWRAMRRFCGGHDALMSAREKEFIENLKRWRGGLTPKQRDWLTAIYQRLLDEAA